MAVKAHCLKFIALSTVQNLLTDIWNGKVEAKSGLKASIYVGSKNNLHRKLLKT